MSDQIIVVSSLNSISPGNYIIESFEKKGFEVIAISDVSHPKARLVKFGSVDIAKYVIENKLKPRFLLFVEGGEMGVFPINLGNLEFPTYWWGIDTHNDYEKHYNICQLFDHSFIAQKKYVEQLIEDGIASASWLPLAFPLQNIKSTYRDIDISYVGSLDWNLYPERHALIQALKSLGFNNYFGTCKPSEMFKIYSKSKIVFNYSLKNDLNMRIFEAMGSGALLVTNVIYDNGLEDLFENGKDFLIYRNSQELISIVSTQLNNPELCSKIAKSGNEIIMAKHTYEKRAENILQMLSNTLSKNYNNDYEILVLMQMGLYSDCLKTYMENLIYSVKGKRNRLIITAIRPLFRFIVIIAKSIESFTNKNRLNRW